MARVCNLDDADRLGGDSFSHSRLTRLKDGVLDGGESLALAWTMPEIVYSANISSLSSR